MFNKCWYWSPHYIYSYHHYIEIMNLVIHSNMQKFDNLSKASTILVLIIKTWIFNTIIISILVIWYHGESHVFAQHLFHVSS
jgi:hypothetical protein